MLCKTLSRVILGGLVLSAMDPFPIWSQCSPKAIVSTIEALTPDLTFKGNTCGFTDTLNAYTGPFCLNPGVNYPGRDVIYKVVLHENNRVGFQLDMQKPADLTMALVKECGKSDKCERSSIDYRGSNSESIAPFGYTAGVYYLYIDSKKASECGPYTLRVTGYNPTPDLNLGLSTDSAPTAGKDLTYNLTVSNVGNLTAHNVKITQTLPSGIERVRSSGCSVSGNSFVSCTIPVLNFNETMKRSVTVFVKPDTRVLLKSTANAVADEGDPTPNERLLESKVKTDVSLSFQNNFPVEVVAGNSTTYTLTLSNNGLSDATKVKVNVGLPQGMSCTAGVNGCTNGRQLSYMVDRVRTRSSVSMPVTVHVSPSASGALSQSASVTSAAELGPTTPPVSATIGTQAVRQTNLAISRTGPAPSRRAAGETVTYELRVENKGPSNSRGASVNNTLPPGLVFDSSQECTPTSANAVTCEIGPLQVGVGKPVSFVARIGSGVEPQTLSNVATVVAKDEDLVTTDNVATIKTDVFVEADMRAQILKVERLSWTLPSTPGDVKAGESLLYTVKAVNNGPSDFRGGTMEARLPAGLAFISSPDGCSVADRTCSVPDLKKGAEAVRRFVVGIAPWKSGLIGNKVCINSKVAEHDTEVENDCSEDTSTRVENEADLALTLNGPLGAVHPGDEFTYRVSVQNEGPSNASHVSVDLDGVPIEIGDVKAGTAESRAVPVVAPNERGFVRAEANLHTDSDSPNNTAKVTTTVATDEDADLAVSLSVDAEAAVAGTSLTYKLTVTNLGFKASGEAEVSVSFSPAASVAPSDCCSFESLAPGTSETRPLTVDVGSTDSLLATAEILQTDLNPDNNHFSLEIPVVQTTKETDLCASWSVRFLRGQPAGASTSLGFVVPRKPSYKDGEVVPMVALGRVFTESGDFVQTVSVPFSGTEEFQTPTLALLAGSGSIEWTFKKGYVGNVSSVHKRDGATIAIPGFCRRPGHIGAHALILPFFQVDSAVNTYVAIRNETDEQVDVRITYSSESEEPRQQVIKLAGHGVSTVNVRGELKKSWKGSLEIESFSDEQSVEALSGDFIQVGPDGLSGSTLERKPD